MDYKPHKRTQDSEGSMSTDFDKVIQEIELLHERVDKLEERIKALEKEN